MGISGSGFDGNYNQNEVQTFSFQSEVYRSGVCTQLQVGMRAGIGLPSGAPDLQTTQKNMQTIGVSDSCDTNMALQAMIPATAVLGSRTSNSTPRNTKSAMARTGTSCEPGQTPLSCLEVEW